MQSNWKNWKSYTVPGAPYILEDGIWDCMGENMVTTHIRMHEAGVDINSIKGYKNLDIGFGDPNERV